MNEQELLDDWQLMPKEPTKQMVQAACDATFGPSPLTPEEAHRLGYAAMILVAPTPPAPTEIEKLLKNAGLTSRDGTFVSAPTREIAAALRSLQAPSSTPIRRQNR